LVHFDTPTLDRHAKAVTDVCKQYSDVMSWPRGSLWYFGLDIATLVSVN